MKSPTRPLIRYHGGKWRLAPWIITHFPEHRVYVEPFGGGGSVLLRKTRSYAEIYNDLDSEVVNLFRMARDHGEELVRLCHLTPFANEEFKDAFAPASSPLEQARRTVVRAFMGFGSASVTSFKHTSRIGKATTGFRANSNRSGTPPSADWTNYPEALRLVVERLRGVVIENRDALAVMTQHDAPATLHYVDPPYVSGTRDKGTDYAHEMNEGDHMRMADCLLKLTGMVMVSGYRSELYDNLFSEWSRVDIHALADGAKPRVECLWLSPSLVARMPQPSLALEAA
jgi:DNA adenine methylase